ncbi:MAG TPA: BrnT family toxin [Methylophilaceae bacterium]|nr:BrnT family toxin [Methylophilaceae bacterium]
MAFTIQFDPQKAQSNFRKHGIRLTDAATVLSDARALSMEDCDHDEERWITLGEDSNGRILVVVYTYRDPNFVRLISARKAQPREIQQYRGG